MKFHFFSSDGEHTWFDGDVFFDATFYAGDKQLTLRRAVGEGTWISEDISGHPEWVEIRDAKDVQERHGLTDLERTRLETLMAADTL